MQRNAHRERRAHSNSLLSRYGKINNVPSLFTHVNKIICESVAIFTALFSQPLEQ